MATYPETADNAGLVVTRRARQTGLLVSLYNASEQGIEDDPETPWALVCEPHAGCVCFVTQQEARNWMADPQGWCPTCQDNRDLAKNEGAPHA